MHTSKHRSHQTDRDERERENLVACPFSPGIIIANHPKVNLNPNISAVGRRSGRVGSRGGRRMIDLRISFPHSRQDGLRVASPPCLTNLRGA